MKIFLPGPTKRKTDEKKTKKTDVSCIKFPIRTKNIAMMMD